ncbi:putative ribonuclease H-like domain-containing protein [Tanacetum coccineum]
MVPRAVLMKSGLVSINTARQNISKTAVLVNTTRQVNTAHSETIVNAARPMSYLSKIAHSTVKRPIYKNTSFKNSNINQRDNTIRGTNVNTVRPKAVVNIGNTQIDLQDQGVIDSGCSRHMTRNMSYFIDYEEIDGGYVAFGRNPKGGKITEKSTIKTVPRKNNMYSVDLKNIVPKGCLTCLFEKATSDESKLWHKRLGHLNFKTMNKLVKGNLVRGLPSKLFENDQTCVACQKGKQHRASSTKDETSGILKSFITRIENLGDHKVKEIDKHFVEQMVLRELLEADTVGNEKVLHKIMYVVERNNTVVRLVVTVVDSECFHNSLNGDQNLAHSGVKSEDEANVEDTAYPGKEDGLGLTSPSCKGKKPAIREGC